MIERLLHTPEGVRDIYNGECEWKLDLEYKMHKVLRQFGFRDIETPTFEYFDIFSRERGTVQEKDVYRFFDREGNTLALRPDITPSIARCAAKYYKEESLPLRLSYMGNTYINHSGYQGKLKETTQIGIELMNDNSIEADAEMIAVTIKCLLQAGLKEFQVEIGNADFFKGLMEEADFTADEVEQLRVLIEDKNVFGVEGFVAGKMLPQPLKDILLRLPNLFGSMELLEDARKITGNPRSQEAIRRFEQLYKILEIYGFSHYITFDLGMLSKYNYYTGIIFRAYTYGTGEAVATGGRYDNLVGQFGKETPAIGAAIVVDQLMVAMQRQKLEEDIDNTGTLLLYKESYRETAIILAEHFRMEGMAVILIKQDEVHNMKHYIDYARKNRAGGILSVDDANLIQIINLESGESVKAVISDLIKGEEKMV